MAFLAHRNRKLMMRRGYPEYFVPLVFTFLACSYIMFPMWVQLAVTVPMYGGYEAVPRLYLYRSQQNISPLWSDCSDSPTHNYTQRHTNTQSCVCQVCVKLWHMQHRTHRKCLLVCKFVTHTTQNTCNTVSQVCVKLWHVAHTTQATSVSRVCSTTLCLLCPNYNCQAAAQSAQVWILLQHLAWPRL